ncbi:MAG: hypothetical protein V4722_18140 [Bacteroidota bacterium]
MMKKITPKKRRLLLWIGIPLLLLIVLGVIFLSIGVNTFLKPTIKKALSKVVVDGSDSLYTFSLGDYSVGPGGRTVTINKLEIVVDSNRYRILKAANRLPGLIFSIKIDALVVTGLQPWTLWRHKNIYCNEIAIANSTIIIEQQQKRKGDTMASATPKTLYESIKPDINNINIGKINVTNSDITFKTAKRQTNLDSWRIEKMRIQMTDVVVDSLTYADTARILYAGNLQTSFDNLKMKTQDGLYNYSLGKTEYDFKKRSVDIADIKLAPAIGQAEFNKRFGHAKDRFHLDIKKTSIENFNASALLIDDQIEAASVILESPVLDVYKDKSPGKDLTNKMGTYPHQLLLKAENSIDIDRIKINQGRLTFTEKSAKTGLEGPFKFTNINGTITNATNQPEVYARERWCKASLTASFMGNNDMSAIFNFDLPSPDGHFTIDAGLKSLQASQVNTTFKNLAKAEMESFVLDDLQYHIEGNDNMATADLKMKYHDMKLNVYKTDEEGEFKKKGLISLLANLIKIYPANPMPGEQERVARGIRNPRIVTKNLFGYAVFTLLKCVQEIAIKGKNKTLPGMGN